MDEQASPRPDIPLVPSDDEDEREPSPTPALGAARYAPEDEFFAQGYGSSEWLQKQRDLRKLKEFIDSHRRAASHKARFNPTGSGSAYIDQDESGTYDPSGKRRHLTPSPEPSSAPKVKRVKVDQFDEDGNLIVRKRSMVGYRSLVTFHFTEANSLEYLRSIKDGNESEHADGEDSEDGSGYGASFPKKSRRTVKKPQRWGISTRDDGLTLDDLTAGHPQRRGCKACFLSGNDACSLLEDPHTYPCEACDDCEGDCELIIPPKFKKACERCKALRMECSYDIDAGRYQNSCQACADDELPCCAGPRDEDTLSRRMNDVLSRSKEEREYFTNLRKGRLAAKDRKYVSCNQCRYKKVRCSLVGKKALGPCSYCKKLDQHCEFTSIREYTELPASLRALAPNLILREKNIRNRETTPEGFTSRDQAGEPHTPNTNTRTLAGEIEKRYTSRQKRKQDKKLTSSSTRKGKGKERSCDVVVESPKLVGITAGIRHIHMKTSFCHPITFNYQPPPEFSPFELQTGEKSTTISPPKDEVCHFCESPFFGQAGLTDKFGGPKNVEGFYWPDGSGFEEISGGYSELGLMPTKMCGACTTSRIEIMTCFKHQVVPLTVADTPLLDPQVVNKAAQASFARDFAPGKLLKEAKWCSICPSLADFKCCQEQIGFNGDGEEVTVKGCGLYLCEDCEVLMGKAFTGGVTRNPEIIATVIGIIESQSYRFQTGVRADASFLTNEGELMARLQQNFGQKDVEDSTDVRPDAFTGQEPKNKYGHDDEHGDSDDVGPPAKKFKGPDLKGKGKDWSAFAPEMRPKGWDETRGDYDDDLATAIWNSLAAGGHKESGKSGSSTIIDLTEDDD